jgi:hypothetical protein
LERFLKRIFLIKLKNDKLSSEMWLTVKNILLGKRHYSMWSKVIAERKAVIEAHERAERISRRWQERAAEIHRMSKKI